jgi:hypothetical protein
MVCNAPSVPKNPLELAIIMHTEILLQLILFKWPCVKVSQHQKFGSKRLNVFRTALETKLKILGSWGSSVKVVVRLWAGWLGFNSQQGQGFFTFTTTSIPALVPAQPTI